jgi:hypothetical protein
MAATATKMKRVAICVFVSSLFVLANQIAGQERNPVWHLITGTVVDERDQPVKGANVCAMGTFATSGRIPCGESNAKGDFSITVQRLSTYTVYAEHFERGYPGMWSFYGKLWQDFPQVAIDEKTSSIAPVKLKLGPKAGRLVLTILDGTSAKPIESGAIVLCRSEEPGSCWSISTGWPKGHYEILTPDVAFTMKFKTWHGEWVERKAFDDQGLPIQSVKVELGSQKEMTIRLK